MKPATTPPVRRLFIPSLGYLLFEGDLARADAQIVAAESGDAALLAAFRENLDIHTDNAKWCYSSHFVTAEQRQWNKNGVHAVDYACKARTLATTLHVSVRRAEEWIDRWFTLHPSILDWHKRVDRELRLRRTVSNIYGFRKYYTDRLDALLPQALAWIASSTVSITINKALFRIYSELPLVRPLLQIHDSVLGQVPLDQADALLPSIREAMQVEIPYSQPLVIPVTLKVSTKSWGDMETWPWKEAA